MMQKHRGIVCEINDDYAVFLTESGDFIQGTPLVGIPGIGDECEFHPLPIVPAKRSKMKPRFVATVMVAAAFFVFVVLSFNQLSDDAMAYLQLETDNTVEFGVDQKGNVMSLRYLNESLAGSTDSLVEWKGYPIRIVLDTVVEEFSATATGERIIVTKVYSTDNKHSKVQVFVDDAVQTVRDEHQDLNWEVSEGTERERELANELDMSIHQFKKDNPPSPKKKINVNPLNEHEQQKKIPRQMGKEAQNRSDIAADSRPSNSKKEIQGKKNEVNNSGRLHPSQARAVVKNVQEKSNGQAAIQIAKEVPPALGKNRPDKSNQKPSIKPVQEKFNQSGNRNRNESKKEKTKQPKNEKSRN